VHHQLEGQMIIADVLTPWSEHLTLAFMDGHMPREGEFISLTEGKTRELYRVTRVTHRFSHQKIANALKNQRHFADIPALLINVEKATARR
jgi:hypothetical protein